MDNSKIFLIIFSTLFLVSGSMSAQDTLFLTQPIDSLKLFGKDTLGLKLSYPLERRIPADILNIPAPSSPLEIDNRTGSYYTPRNVQDKMDNIMNRPRRDSFVPILGLAAFAISVAAKQMEAAKLFDPAAEDYLLPEKEYQVLEQLWKKSPQRIDDLYLNTSLKEGNTANELQKTIKALSDKNLIKTRTDGNDDVLFFPGQKLDHVKTLIQKASSDTKRPEEEIHKFLSLKHKLQGIDIVSGNTPQDVE